MAVFCPFRTKYHKSTLSSTFRQQIAITYDIYWENGRRFDGFEQNTVLSTFRRQKAFCSKRTKYLPISIGKTEGVLSRRKKPSKIHVR